jgi:hypothetical protein
MTKPTLKQFRKAIKAAKAAGYGDPSKQHRVAIDTLTAECGGCSAELIADLAWEAVKASRD